MYCNMYICILNKSWYYGIIRDLSVKQHKIKHLNSYNYTVNNIKDNHTNIISIFNVSYKWMVHFKTMEVFVVSSTHKLQCKFKILTNNYLKINKNMDHIRRN